MAPISLIYHQGSGVIETPSGVTVAHGWAGHGEWKNRPEAEGERAKGPLPAGIYVVGVWGDHPRLGPIVAPLTQIEGESYGRDAFFIHGPSTDLTHYGQESMGCIVVPRASRLIVRDNAPEGSYLKVEA